MWINIIVMVIYNVLDKSRFSQSPAFLSCHLFTGITVCAVYIRLLYWLATTNGIGLPVGGEEKY